MKTTTLIAILTLSLMACSRPNPAFEEDAGGDPDAGRPATPLPRDAGADTRHQLGDAVPIDRPGHQLPLPDGGGADADVEPDTGLDAEAPDGEEVGSGELVLEAPAPPRSLAIGAGFLWWADGSAIRRAQLAGGSVEDFWPAPADLVAVTSVHLLWTSEEVGSLYRMPIDLSDSPARLLRDFLTLPGLSVDAITDDCYVAARPGAEPAGSVYRIQGSDGTPLEVAAQQPGPAAPVGEYGEASWVNREGGQVVSRQNGVVASGLDCPSFVGLGQEYLFVLTGACEGVGQLLRFQRFVPDPPPTVLARDLVNPSGLAVYEDEVYLLAGRKVLRMFAPRGELEVLATASGPTGSVVVGPEHVFWVEGSTIRRVAR